MVEIRLVHLKDMIVAAEEIGDVIFEFSIDVFVIFKSVFVFGVVTFEIEKGMKMSLPKNYYPNNNSFNVQGYVTLS